MRIRKAAALMSANFIESVEPNSKKQRVSEESPEISAPENQLAIVVYVGDAEPINEYRPEEPVKSREPRQKISNGPNPTPPIPEALKQKIENLGGTDWHLIIQKGLQKTDVSRSHARLSMPLTQWATKKALSSELMMMFENGIRKVSVPLIDMKMKLWKSMSLRKWNVSKGYIVISGEWNDLVADNNLKFKDIVQIWCFKFIETGKFGLAMVKIESGNEGISSADSQTAFSSNIVAGLCIQPQAHVSDLVGSSSNSESSQDQSYVFYDFFKGESSGNGSDDHYGRDAGFDADTDLSLHL